MSKKKMGMEREKARRKPVKHQCIVMIYNGNANEVCLAGDFNGIRNNVLQVKEE